MPVWTEKDDDMAQLDLSSIEYSVTEVLHRVISQMLSDFATPREVVPFVKVEISDTHEAFDITAKVFVNERLQHQPES